MYSTSLPFKLCVYPYMSHFSHTASLFSLTSIVPLTIGIIAKRSQSLPSSPHYLHPIPLNMSSRISHTLLAQTAVTISLNPSSSNFLLCAQPWRAIPLDLDNRAAWHLSVPHHRLLLLSVEFVVGCVLLSDTCTHTTTLAVVPHHFDKN